MTAVVAWLALVVSGASFAWQVVSWVRAGQRIRVELLSSLENSGHRQFRIGYAVVVTNVGRIATTVHEINVRMWNDPKLPQGETSYYKVNEKLARGRVIDLPKRLEPGEELIAWYLPDSVEEANRLLPERGRYRVAVVRAGGRRISTSKFEVNKYRERFLGDE